MDSPHKLILTLCCVYFLVIISGVQGLSPSHGVKFRPNRIFVFGDSYADTGNNGKAISRSWKQPYGTTFPGKPTGRFSDGRVLTDYIAKFVGIKSPIPYRWRKYAVNRLKYGMNFACGGTGVFDTLAPEPNMTTQIDLFQQLITNKVYTPLDLSSSVAVFTVSGNDYSYYMATNGSFQGLPAFIGQVIDQIGKNLKRIQSLGVKRIAVTALQPLGCLPTSTFLSSFQQCNSTENQLVNYHNYLLQQAVATLNNGTTDSPFLILDLNSAFMTVFKNKGARPGSTTFANPLQPCCVGTSTEYSCGDVDAKGTKMYTVCGNPEATFFWDGAHPTQEGWKSVYYALQSNLQQL